MPWKKKFNFLNLPEVFSRLVILSRTVTNESNDQLVCHTTHAHHHWHIFRCVRTRTHKSSTDTSCCRIYLEKLSIIISQSNWPRLSLANFRVLEGRSCDHSDKQPDHIISRFNSTSSSAQYIYKINLYYPPTHTHLHVPRGFFPSGFSPKIIYALSPYIQNVLPLHCPLF